MSDERKIAKIEVSVGMIGCSPESRVILNGHDITQSVCGFRIDASVDHVTRVWLEVIPGHTEVTARAALEDVKFVGAPDDAFDDKAASSRAEAHS